MPLVEMATGHGRFQAVLQVIKPGIKAAASPMGSVLSLWCPGIGLSCQAHACPGVGWHAFF